MTKYQEFYEILKRTFEYYQRDLSDDVADIYWLGLKHLDNRAVADCLQKHMTSRDTAGRFCPKLTDILQMLEGSSVDGALLAWTKVANAIRLVGPYRSIVFDDPLIHVVLAEMSGWVHVCSTPTMEALPFVARDFEARYRSHASRQSVPQYQPVMIGMAEAANAPEGRPFEAAKLFGDHEKCVAVKEKGISTDQQMLNQIYSKLDKPVARSN